MSLRCMSVAAVLAAGVATALLSVAPASASQQSRPENSHASGVATATMRAPVASPVRDASALRLLTPDVNNVIVSLADAVAYEACDAGAVYSLNASLEPVVGVDNNCEYRIYLQYTDGSSYCIDPHYDKTYIGPAWQYPAALKIGESTDDC